MMVQLPEARIHISEETWGGVRILGGEDRDWSGEVEMVRFDDAMGIVLWRHIDLKDFSTARFFVTTLVNPKFVFEVDFFSRHDLISPMSKDSLPRGWEEWAAVTRGSIFVFDKGAFARGMLTADAYVALPLYRFDNLVSDAQAAADGNKASATAVMFKILSSRFTGYSFKLYVSGNSYDEETLELCVAHSCLEGRIHEDSRLLRPAFEQLELR